MTHPSPPSTLLWAATFDLPLLPGRDHPLFPCVFWFLSLTSALLLASRLPCSAYKHASFLHPLKKNASALFLLQAHFSLLPSICFQSIHSSQFLCSLLSSGTLTSVTMISRILCWKHTFPSQWSLPDSHSTLSLSAVHTVDLSPLCTLPSAGLC